MSDCPYCGVSIDEAYNFCASCEQQVKCTSCACYLLKGKSKCLSCGTVLKNSQSSVAKNTYTLEEKQSGDNYSKKVNLSFSDSAIDKVPHIFEGHYQSVGSTIDFRPNIQHRVPLTFNSAGIEVKGAEEEGTSESLDQKSVEAAVQGVSSASTALNYFEKDEQGFLVSKDPDYRGDSKKEQQIRFTVMYVWAYQEILGEAMPAEGHLNQAARINGVYNQNYPNYAKGTANRLFINVNGVFRLNPSGIREVEILLKEMEETDKKGAEYWKPSKRNNSRGSRVTKEESDKISGWLKIPSGLESFDLRKLVKNYELVIFTLYDITKGIKVESSVKAGVAYEYLVKRYKNAPLNKTQFVQAASDGKKYFTKTAKGEYYLTKEAERIMNNLLSGNNSTENDNAAT